VPWDDLLRQCQQNRLSVKIDQHATVRDTTHNDTLKTLANSERLCSINRQHLRRRYNMAWSTKT
jgi:hypothetical protein